MTILDISDSTIIVAFIIILLPCGLLFTLEFILLKRNNRVIELLKKLKQRSSLIYFILIVLGFVINLSIIIALLLVHYKLTGKGLLESF